MTKNNNNDNYKITANIDTQDTNEILASIENMEDEEKAVKLLKEFTSCSKKLSSLLLGKSNNETDNEWKNNIKQAKKDLEQIIKEIKRHAL